MSEQRVRSRQDSSCSSSGRRQIEKLSPRAHLQNLLRRDHLFWSSSTANTISLVTVRYDANAPFEAKLRPSELSNLERYPASMKNDY
jgi:hypothetical protein